MSHFIDKGNFIPDDIDIIKRVETSEGILLKLKSKTRSQPCPLCRCESRSYHGTYRRKILDLPFGGKPNILQITAYKYNCDNVKCGQKVFCEELHGFVSKYGRITSRCESLVAAVALYTNCEAASLICRHMGIKVSGDTLVRLLTKRSTGFGVENKSRNHIKKVTYKMVGDYAKAILDLLPHLIHMDDKINFERDILSMVKDAFQLK